MENWQTQNVAGLVGGVLATCAAIAAAWQTYQSRKISLGGQALELKTKEDALASGMEDRLVVRRREINEQWEEYADKVETRYKGELDEVKEELTVLRKDHTECLKTSARQDQELIHVRGIVADMREALKNQGLKMPKVRELKTDEPDQNPGITS